MGIDWIDRAESEQKEGKCGYSVRSLTGVAPETAVCANGTEVVMSAVRVNLVLDADRCEKEEHNGKEVSRNEKYIDDQIWDYPELMGILSNFDFIKYM